ncbi:hypothetical protein EON67_02220 [archaeon]|nr:MAG: hypothetical protein EON67_02220 [archaeon]
MLLGRRTVFACADYNFSWTDFMTDVKNTLDSMREKSTNSDPTIDELKVCSRAHSPPTCKRVRSRALTSYVHNTHHMCAVLQSALGPPAPEGIISVIMSLDEVVMRRDWDRRYGWRYELRPGVKAMMKQLADQGCIVSFWSQGAAAGVIDAVNKMSLEFGMPMAITQTHVRAGHRTSPTRLCGWLYAYARVCCCRFVACSWVWSTVSLARTAERRSTLSSSIATRRASCSWTRMSCRRWSTLTTRCSSST